MVVHGSLKSATHFTPNRSCNCKPIRCKLCGGPVVIMVSIDSFKIYSERNVTDGFTHDFRASGIKKLPRIYSNSFSINP